MRPARPTLFATLELDTSAGNPSTGRGAPEAAIIVVDATEAADGRGVSASSEGCIPDLDDAVVGVAGTVEDMDAVNIVDAVDVSRGVDVSVVRSKGVVGAAGPLIVVSLVGSRDAEVAACLFVVVGVG